MPSSSCARMAPRGTRRLGLKLRLSQKTQPPVGDRAIDIGAGKAGVQAYFLDPLAESAAQIVIKREITKPGGAPVWKGDGGHSR